MINFWYEFLGTMLLVLLGDGVVANMNLAGTKSSGSSAAWIVITLAWGLAVFVGVVVAGPVSGAHLNPAVTVGLALIGAFPWEQAPLYIAGQLAGGAAGALLVWVFFRSHFDETKEPGTILACYCTGPAIRNYRDNFVCEVIGTFVLIFAIFYIASPSIQGNGFDQVKFKLGTLEALPVSLVVMGIGMSLGGTTGYAINPARDLGPRIMHALLPMKHKGASDWSYSWIPVLAPIVGAGLAAMIFLMLKSK
ncbi:MAG: MIP/aquaporin family protein [Prolixibacteraceae bacterium]